MRSEPDSNKTRRICKTPRADPAWLALLFDSTPPSAARSEAAVQSLIILRTERLTLLPNDLGKVEAFVREHARAVRGAAA